MKTSLDAARSYLAKLPPAISGAGGHRATFRAACECVRFGLSDGEALTLLREWNVNHCKPPWTEKELTHKLKDARRVAAGQLRRVMQARPAIRKVWKIERKTHEPIRTTPPQPTLQPEPEQEPAKLADLRGVAVFSPGGNISSEFLKVLATWTALRRHCVWKNHPQFARYDASAKTRLLTEGRSARTPLNEICKSTRHPP